MSSWAPPAFLKSNGQVGNGGTLLDTNGGFVYNEFAQYWYDSLQAYRSNGVSPTWISIQNEPDFEASYDSCVLRPSEGVVNGTNYASYAKALEAVYNKLTNLPAPPKLLAPEVVHIRFNTLANYAATRTPIIFMAWLTIFMATARMGRWMATLGACGPRRIISPASRIS
jgi:glucuronoarabinoxylan endo-1,4-beta-xylanase